MKLIYYPSAYLLSRLLAYFLKRRYVRASGYVDKDRFAALLKVVKNQMLSPIRNGFLDLTKKLIAAYFVAPGDMVIDAGAHLGSHTLYYSSLVGTTGRVYSYEAHPQIFQKLKDRFQGFPQVTACNFAVSNRSECRIPMKIYPDELHHECATVEETLMNSERMPGNTALVSVPCQKLDDHLAEKNIGQCSLVKIDVEGHEHAVLEGAAKLIQKHNPIIIYEYGYEPGQFEPRTIEQMNNYGYVSYDCKTLKRVYPLYNPRSVTDLVAVPGERMQEFEALISLLT